MSSIKDFLRCYNIKDVVPTLEAMQKTIATCNDKDIDMLRLGYTLPNLANKCLHNFTHTKFYPITEADKDLGEKMSVVLLAFSQAKQLLTFFKVYKQERNNCWD